MNSFRENQAFAPFVYALMAGTILLMVLLPGPKYMNAIPVVLLTLTSNLLYVRTSVDRRDIRVQFGFAFPYYVRTIPIDTVASAAAITYSPLAEYGGWGIRGFGDRVALNARGDRGVLLTLRTGATILIGSQRAEELAAAIDEAKKS